MVGFMPFFQYRTMNCNAGTEELRTAYTEACKEFIRTWKERWEAEDYLFFDELMLWAFRRAFGKELGMEEFGVEE